MSNDFFVHTREITLLDEHDFLDHGGEELHFGAIQDSVVHLFASGSHDAIRRLAGQIRHHHTAA